MRNDTAHFTFNGLHYTMRVGEVAMVDSQTQGLISHQIKADQKNKYLTPVLLLNGGSVQGEVVDRNLDVTVIPVADADRLNLPYKDKKVQTHARRSRRSLRPRTAREVKTIVEPKDGTAKPATYRTWVLPLNSIRVGAVDVWCHRHR